MNKDPKNTMNNFDKEFSLNKKQTGNGRRKVPAWIGVLVAVAAISAVVVAVNPSVRKEQTGAETRAALTIPAENVVVGDPAAVLDVNDQRADSAELEARIGTQTSDLRVKSAVITGLDDQTYNMTIEEIADENMDAESDSPVFVVDGTSYALSVESEEGEPVESSVDAEDSSIIWIENQPYRVRIEKLSDAEYAGLSDEAKENILTINDQNYELEVNAVDPAMITSDDAPEEKTAEVSDTEENTEASTKGANIEKDVDPFENSSMASVIAPEDDPFAIDAEPELTAKEAPAAVARLNDKVYTVTVNPVSSEEVEAEDAEPAENNVANIPVTMLDDNGNVIENEPVDEKVVSFDFNGEPYEITLRAVDEEDIPENAADQTIIWVGEEPLELVLVPEQSADAAIESGEENSENDTESSEAFEIILNPLPDEQTAALKAEVLGITENAAPVETDSNEAAEETVDGTETVNGNENDANWFVQFFQNIFGAEETTAEPTPQVTVIALTPTPTLIQPTKTPIVLSYAPTVVAEGPVRLDENSGEAEQTLDAKTSDLEDPALYDPDYEETEPTAAPTTRPTAVSLSPILLEPADELPDENEETVIEAPGSEDVDTENENPETDPDEGAESETIPTAEPEAEELPHTGTAESWNIPAMLVMFAGLLLVIIGVRRLRSNRN